jgi:peptidoglycan/xylan/chitin deacetylase (PgdA/CDA1 family)
MMLAVNAIAQLSARASSTLEALPQIISNLKAKGYEFVTLPELLKD